MRQNSLTKNTIYNTIYKSLNVIFPLVTTMYVTRILLSEGVGKIASAQNLATYFTLIAALGLPTYGTRKIASNRDNPIELGKVFTELYIINGISTITCTACYYLIVFSTGLYSKELVLYSIVGLQIVLNLFNIDWFYQGIEQYKYIMLRSIMVKIISVLAIFIFVKSQEDYIRYAFISTFAIAFNYILNVMHLKGKVQIQMHDINIRQHLKPVFVLLASSIAVEIYTLADVTMLTGMTNESIVGYYTTSMKGIKIIKNFITSICAAFLPRLSYYYAESRFEDFKLLAKRGLKLIIFLSLPAAVACFFLADAVVILLFGNGFIESITTTKILAPSILTIAISNFVGYQILVATGHEKQMMIVTVIGAITNIILNFCLIPSLLHNGAAIASVITEGFVAITQFLVMKKLIGITIERRYFVSVIIPLIIMATELVLIKLLPISNILICLTAGMIGSFTYGSITAIMKNDMSLLLINKVKSALRR